MTMVWMGVRQGGAAVALPSHSNMVVGLPSRFSGSFLDFAPSLCVYCRPGRFKARGPNTAHGRIVIGP